MGQSKRSNQPGIVAPPLIVIGIVGAAGKVHSISGLFRRASKRANWCLRSDHPAGVSPRPCRKMTPAFILSAALQVLAAAEARMLR